MYRNSQRLTVNGDRERAPKGVFRLLHADDCGDFTSVRRPLAVRGRNKIDTVIDNRYIFMV